MADFWRDLVWIAFGILFGGLVLALAVAFGLGGRSLARRVLERGRPREREPREREPVSHI